MIHTHISKQLLLCSVLFFSACGFGQKDEVSFLFVGDVMGHDGQLNAARNSFTGGFSYDDGFKFVRPIIQSYDFSIANLEITHAGEPYKGYPRFSSPPELSECLVNTGFDIILTANNHSCDGGDKGVLGTLDVLDDLGVMHTGTFRSKAERDSAYPLMIEKNGIKVAVLNYTYGTNGLTVKAPIIINYIDSLVIKADVREAKNRGAEYIICTMHWGQEYEPLPSGYQKTYEELCYDLGIDMVIGGHPHVLQPIERKTIRDKERLTAWSLGNFVSNQRARYKNGGVMLTSSIFKSEDGIKIKDASYILAYVHVKQEGVISPYYILPEFEYNILRPDFIDPGEKSKMDQFFQDSRQLFEKHSKGMLEKLIQADSSWMEQYNLLLTENFAIELINGDRNLLNEEYIASEFHLFVDNQGKEHLLFGLSDEKAELEKELKYLAYCFPQGKLKRVKYTAGEITYLEE